MKKLYQVLIILDDYADSPQLHKAHGALDTLFIRGRHMQISTWVSSQKLRLISTAVRVNMQFLCCWRLRNQHELDAVIEELSALLPKDKLRRIYEQATREPYSFLFVYYLKPKNQMFITHLLGVGLPVQPGEARVVQPAQPCGVFFWQGDRLTGAGRWAWVATLRLGTWH